MSDYDRSYYAPPKALPARSAKRTVPPPWETLMFVTEWYWLPEGVKEVSERIEKFLADNQIVSTTCFLSFQMAIFCFVGLFYLLVSPSQSTTFTLWDISYFTSCMLLFDLSLEYLLAGS